MRLLRRYTSFNDTRPFKRFQYSLCCCTARCNRTVEMLWVSFQSKETSNDFHSGKSMVTRTHDADDDGDDDDVFTLAIFFSLVFPLNFRYWCKIKCRNTQTVHRECTAIHCTSKQKRRLDGMPLIWNLCKKFQHVHVQSLNLRWQAHNALRSQLFH